MWVKDAGRDTGLIPAHAGKTPGSVDSHAASWAHPRSRGENGKAIVSFDAGSGSSPLTRGKPQHTHPGQQARRLIPAHAGKTNVVISPCLARRAHPRSRGENAVEMEPAVVRTGSSPLTRGKQLVGALVLDGLGLIPAHAGKTRGRSKTPSRRPAHPRSRGENCLLQSVQAITMGSSPLTRGKQERGAPGNACHRLIPAHAGKT